MRSEAAGIASQLAPSKFRSALIPCGSRSAPLRSATRRSDVAEPREVGVGPVRCGKSRWRRPVAAGAARIVWAAAPDSIPLPHDELKAPTPSSQGSTDRRYASRATSRRKSRAAGGSAGDAWDRQREDEYTAGNRVASRGAVGWRVVACTMIAQPVMTPPGRDHRPDSVTTSHIRTCGRSITWMAGDKARTRFGPILPAS